MIGILKLMIVDDHQIMIDGLCALLQNEAHLQIVFTCTSATQALDILAHQLPDIIITDINMPVIDGIAFTKKVSVLYPNIPVLVLTMHNDFSMITEIINSGASGYILKNTGKTQLLQAIKTISEGKQYFSAEVTSTIAESNRNKNLSTIEGSIAYNPIHLTQRELEIMHLIAKEQSNQEIANSLFISERTVETHRKNIFRKIDTRTVVGLIKYMAKHGIL